MGLMDFVKDVGRQIFDTDAEAAANIRQHLEIKTSGIKNLDVEFDSGIATIRGDCENQVTKDMAMLIVGNVKGVEKIDADGLTVPPEPVRVKSAEFYTIASGDTLGAIAQRYYGKASAYTRIFEANREIIADPDKIYPGQTIRIPLD